MDVAVFNLDAAAVCADQLCGVEILVVLQHPSLAILKTSEIGLLAFEALEIAVNSHCIVLRKLIVRAIWVFELLVIQPVLEFQPLNRF